MKVAFFFGFCAVCATANYCCDNSGDNPKGTQNFCHIACKMYVGECCHTKGVGRCCCGAIYDHGWNRKCTGDDCTANAHWFTNPKKKSFVAQKIYQPMNAAHASDAFHSLVAESGSHVGASAGEIDVSFADKSYQTIFGEDFSWDQRNDEAKYFDVGNHGNRKALRIRVYEGDKTAWKGNPSCPRTELRPRTRDTLKTETDYTAEFEYQLQQYTAPYKFAIMQLYGGAPRNRPNIFLRYGSHNKQQYNILCEQCDKPSHDFEIAGNAGEDIGKWIKWRVEFRLSASSHGHLRFYHNGKQVYTYSGKTSDGSSHNWKTGIYTQGHPDCDTKNTVAYLSNLKIRPTGAAGFDSTNTKSAESDLDASGVSELPGENSTVGQPRSQPECCMWKDWDGCLAQSIKEGAQAACETVSCSRTKTCPGAPKPHTTGDWCNQKSWANHCKSGWASGCACQMGTSDAEVLV